MLDRIRELLTGESAFQRWTKKIRKAEKQQPDYEMLMKWERSKVESYLRSDPHGRFPMESFFEEISYTWYKAGFVFQANRVMRDYEYWREIERKRRSDYEQQQREERAKRKEAAAEQEVPAHHVQVDANGFEDHSQYSTTDLEFVNPKYQQRKTPTNQPSQPATTASPPTAGLTVTEEQMIENHANPRLFVSKARIIKPLFMAGKSDREISESLGDGYGERIVKYYCSIFRKTSPFK